MPVFKLNISDRSDMFTRQIQQHQTRDVLFVTAYAPKTAGNIKAEEVQVIARVLECPTRFTLNVLAGRPAMKNRLVAEGVLS